MAGSSITKEDGRNHMFCSEVEMGGFLCSLDLIEDVYQANLETSSWTYYKLHQNFSGFQVLAFNCPSSDYTTRFLNGGFKLVSSKDHEVIDFVSTKVNPLFSINEGAVRLFEGLFVELKELENQLNIFKPLFVTGRSLGGYIAVLFTLWLQNAIDEKEADNVKDMKRPICITFGCPLVGNETLQKAISQRPQWKSRFLNVIVKTDPIASFYSSNNLYKPFGTTLFCTESGGYMVFEHQESVLAVLHSGMASSITRNTEIPDYGNYLKEIQRKVLYRGVSELGEFKLNSLRAGITLQFWEVGQMLMNDRLKDLIEGMELKLAKKIKGQKYVYEDIRNVNKTVVSLTVIEQYMTISRSKRGYYDAYKKPENKTERDRNNKTVLHHLILNHYWRTLAKEKDLMPQKEGARLRVRWLYRGNNYRRLVEPLDIAEHYKLNGEYYKNGKKHYLENRPIHYRLLEEWLNEHKKDLNPSERRYKAARLNDDSCFWAHVEEALILLAELKNGRSSSGIADIRSQKLEEFEAYLISSIKNYSLSKDVFLEGSSLMKWWNEYKEHKGSLYGSEFAEFMNNQRYISYN